MIETRFVDTNVLLRFFTGTPPDLAEKAKQIVTEADAGKVVLEILPLVLAETIYTLQSFYRMPKEEVCDRLSAFLTSRGIQMRDEVRTIRVDTSGRHVGSAGLDREFLHSSTLQAASRADV